MLEAASAPILIFVLYGFIGLGFLGLWNRRPFPTLTFLVAPAVGLAVMQASGTWLSLAGLGARAYGVPITILLAAVSAVALFARRVSLLQSKNWAFGLLVVPVIVTYAIHAQGLFRFGFDWIAFGNGDWTFYCAAAGGLYERGLYETIPMSDWISNTDRSFAGSLTINSEARMGTEMLLATLMPLFGRTAYEMYMPLSVAVQMMLPLACAALVLTCRRPVPTALFTASLCALSPLLTYGFFLQLLPQSIGLVLIASTIATVTVLLPEEPLDDPATRPSTSAVLPCASLLLGSLVITYPELLGFLAATATLGLALRFVRRQMTRAAALHFMWRIGCIFATAWLAFLPRFLIGLKFGVLTLLLRTGGDKLAAHGSHPLYIFPYFLLPVGFAEFWGLLPIADFFAPYSIQLCYVLVGAALSALLVISAIRQSWALILPASCCLVMLIVSLYFFLSRHDFLLFKMAMYIQPFVLATMSIATVNAFSYWRDGVRAAP